MRERENRQGRGLLSLCVDENFVDFLLLFEVALRLSDSNMLLLPVLCTDGVSSSLNDDTLESFDSLSHFLVKLLLHGVDVEGDVLADAGQERQWLLDALTIHVDLRHF